MMQGINKKEPLGPVHVPVEPAGMNAQGTMHFSQGLLPSSCWLVVPVSSVTHPQVPVPQIQVMTSVDYMRIIDIACSDLAVTTKLKCQKKQGGTRHTMEGAPTREFVNQMTDKMEREAYTRSLAMLNNSGAPSPSLSLSPVSMSPRASNDR
ncbi:hypothetical protein CAEBREN_21872 [Caenorhabditis brenneri]|uniref:Uncharacterized protein n=1 Tax=Caenorhabditis brenneri TaxID=135651 RepID=G0NLA2_CAEBE|nr:hypothetical protein CAEBREN_11982 [Caenorhabditis brenneri]EGT55844.1 hypothetical protein CAEBREN_21872 [Caenorhabditis brenneri]